MAATLARRPAHQQFAFGGKVRAVDCSSPARFDAVLLDRLLCTSLLSAMHQPAFLIALRVIGRLGIGLKPSPADKRTLKESVDAHESKLPIVELCYLILKRELNTEAETKPRWPVHRKASRPSRRKLPARWRVGIDRILPKLYEERAHLDAILASLTAMLEPGSNASGRAAVKRKALRRC